MGGGDERGVHGRLGRALLRRTLGLRRPAARGAERDRPGLRHDDRDRLHDGVRLRRRAADAAAPLRRPGGGLRALPDSRRPDHRRDLGPDHRGVRAAAERVPERRVQLGAGRAADLGRARARPAARLARARGRRGERPRGGACGRGGGPARRARPAGRPGRCGEPLRQGPQLVARRAGGLRRLHPRAARPAAVRPGRDHPRRGRRREGDGDRRRRGRDGLPARERPAARGHAARRGDDLPDAGLPPASRRDGVPGGARLRGARPAQPAGGAPARRDAADRDALAAPARGGRLHAGGDRAGRHARPPRRQHRPEPARVRGRAPDGRGAPAPVGAARRLRLARLARGADADGGGDRLGPHAAAALARPEPRPARRLPRPDRGRDRPAGGARRRGARQLADRRRHVQLLVRRARPGAAHPRDGRCVRGRPRRLGDPGARFRRASRPSAATRCGCGRC